MIVEDESTWPPRLVSCIERHRDALLAWEQQHIDLPPHIPPSARAYDAAISEIRDALAGAHLRGYHCTRLTEAEIQDVLANGLSPQDGGQLALRIDAVVASGELCLEIAERLKTEHHADATYRVGMIWFCFYPPSVLDQGATERLFRSWGGEALYGAGHEDDPQTGPALNRIGTPCVIEADVPIGNDKHTWIETKLSRVFLINRGFHTSEPIHHEGYCTSHIPPENIRNIARYPSKEFMALTGAGNWDPPL